MTGGRRLRDSEDRDEVPDAKGPVAKEVEDADAGRVRESTEHAIDRKVLD